MSSNEQQTEKVIKYIDGELSAEELDAFEALLNNDAVLQAELENMQLARQAVQHYGLVQQVAGVHKNMFAELREGNNGDAHVIPFLRYAMRIAAVLFLLIGAFGVYEFVTVSANNVLPQSKPYVLSVERGVNEVLPIAKAYAGADYHAVVNIFDKEIKPSVKDNFLAGQSYLKIAQPAKAIKAFTEVLQVSPESDFKDDADYYLGLSYLQNNDPVRAKAIFTKIEQDKDHLYHNKVNYFTLLKLNMLIAKSGK